MRQLYFLSLFFWAVSFLMDAADIQEHTGGTVVPYLGYQCFALPFICTFSSMILVNPAFLVWLTNLSVPFTGLFLKQGFPSYRKIVIACAILPSFAILSFYYTGMLKGLRLGFFLWQLSLILNAVVVFKTKPEIN